MKTILMLLFVLVFMVIMPSNAQVKISDTGSTSPGAYSILELESTTKGFLGPRVTLTDLSLVTPLTGTVPAGMLVYNTGGTITNGYYVWNGTKWMPFATGMGSVNVVAKSANATLLKTETFIAASGNITLTLPVITSTDDGLAITIKNIGTYTDQISVVGNSAATIDANDTVKLYRWRARTFVAYNGKWLRREKDINSDNVFDVSPTGSWTTIAEIIGFLGLHMTQEAVVKLDGGTYEIAATQIINLPFHLTIQGASYGEVFIVPVSGIGNTPLFRCQSPCSFKMIDFDGSLLSLYGNTSGQDAIQFETAGSWFEIKDCTFEHFNKTINVMAAVDLWFFESDVSNAVVSGIELAAGAADKITFKISETDFTNCAKGINMVQGMGSTISIQNCSFYCSAGQTGIVYIPLTFLNTASMFITNTAWNNAVGSTYMSGFDFTRPDGRDANIEILNNAGIGNKNPHCKINVTNNVLPDPTKCTTLNAWYKAKWNSNKQSVITTNWTISSSVGTVGRMTFQPKNSKDVVFHIAGNLSVNNPGSIVSICIIKNGDKTTRFGETTLRSSFKAATDDPFQFSTVVYVQNVKQTDYFDLYVTTDLASNYITILDLNI